MQKPITEKTKERARKLRAKGMSLFEISQRLSISHGTASNITRGIKTKRLNHRTIEEKKQAAKEAMAEGGTLRQAAVKAKLSEETIKTLFNLELPKATKRDATPYQINRAGRWLILSDIHLPQHDEGAIRAAVAEAKRRGVVGVLFNGDLLDCHELSVHDKDPTAPRYIEELKIGREFFAWMREQFPKAEFVYKLGNHEERLGKYIIQRAPALEGIEGVDLPSCLDAKKYGLQIIRDKRLICIGKLNVLHGHEYQGGGGVNPARWLFLRARSVALCGHFHRTSEHHAKDIADKYQAAWSTGCLCDLKPLYAPHNEWNHGCAFSELSRDGTFTVDNIRIIDGKIM
jgi:predicted phosphodiesterase